MKAHPLSFATLSQIFKQTLAGNNSDLRTFPLDFFNPEITLQISTHPKQIKPENKPPTNWQKEGF